MFESKRIPARHSGTGRIAKWAIVCVASVGLALACAGASWGSSAYDPVMDVNSMQNTTLYTGAQAWWAAGYTGKGVDVALIDTGVSPVAGLNDSGKVVYGPDLSLESQAPNLRNLDTNGHGTFMAGLIAGRDSNVGAPYVDAPTAYRGMAPDARIVSVKVGTADGGVDVSSVIAAIDWVVQHKSDKGMNIRVINLAYGTNSTQNSDVDPLSYAVEQAWKKGIVVVAAAGNSGYQVGGNSPGIANPAYNPFVIAAGGSDSVATVIQSDDTVGSYSASARCNAPCKRPDFVAPGSHLQGLRVTNSYIDAENPRGVIDERFFRGTGTSEAAAITSGAVALVLQKYPKMPADQVKQFFQDNAVGLSGPSPLSQGAGELNLLPMLTAKPTSKYTQRFHDSTGTGSLEAARGQDHITRDGIVLTGEQDVFGELFNASAMAKLEASGSSWSGGQWNGSTWSGSSWSGSTWSGSTWSGNSWSGSGWSSSIWCGNSWSGNSWSGSSWSGSSWSGSTWSGNSWSSDSWMGATWG